MNSPGRYHRPLGAFTLVELIIAMAVAAISLAMATDLFRSLQASYNRQEAKMERHQEVFDGLSKLFSDLTQAIISWPEVQTDFAGGVESNESPVSYLDFTSLAPSVGLDGSLGVSRPHRVSYRLEGDIGSGQGRLVRRAVPLLGKKQLSQLASQKVLCDQVKSLTLSFWDGKQQQASWSSKNSLPRRVDVFLSTKSGDWSLSIVPLASIGQVEEEEPTP